MKTHFDFGFEEATMFFERDLIAACEERRMRTQSALARQQLLQQLPATQSADWQPRLLFATGTLLVRWGNWLQRQSAAPSTLRPNLNA